MQFFKLIVVTIFLTLAGLGPATAQSLMPTTSVSADSDVTLPDPLTPEAANALISRLSDGEVRSLLLDQLNTQAVEAAPERDAGEFLFHATTGAFGSITKAVERLPALYSGQGRAFSTFYERIGGGTGLLKLLGYMIIVFGAAAIIEIIFRRLTSRWHILPPSDPDDMKLSETLSLLAQRLTTQVVAVVVFIVAARTIGQAITPAEILPIIELIGPYLIAFPRVALAFAFFFFAPMNPEYRLLNLSNKAAKESCRHQFRLALLLGFTAAILLFNEMHGLPRGETRLGFWLNATFHIYLVYILWHFRYELANAMRGFHTDVTPTEDRFARAYPYFAIFVTIAIWWIINIVVSYENFDLLRQNPHYKTMGILMFAPAMDTLIRGLVRHFSPPMSGEGPIAERAYHSAKKSYVRIGRVVVFAVVVIAVARFWGMSATNIASAGVGPQFAAALIEFLIIMAIGYLVYEIVSLYFNRKLAAEQTAAGYMPDEESVGGDGGGAGGSRLSTVLPLILMVSQATIVIVFLLLGLGNIGVDTTPLLAGAGIAGLAIGFGAQKLVTDVVSGIFFLIDDAFRTGEYVEVEGTMGTVEKISIRSMQLRHHKGPVHTIPYGEIPKITNFSRDWVIMKLRFTVPFETDPNKVKKIFKKIGQEMLVLEEFKDDFLQPFKSQGVLEIDDVGMVFRGKFMARPGTQFTIRKEIFNRVNAAFAENGLEFARREVRVALPSMDGKDLTEEDKATIAAAASQAAQTQLEDGAAGGKKDDR
jgi:small-conductance mechanosensitive channel